jgi:hypothetical protein
MIAHASTAVEERKLRIAFNQMVRLYGQLAAKAKESRWKQERLLIIAPVSDRIFFFRHGWHAQKLLTEAQRGNN